MTKNSIPQSLRIWFIIHGIVDLLFAIPLIAFPKQVLEFLGWTIIDPFSTRLVGAALLGIGLVSLIKINDGVESYKSLLTLKMIWSLSAIVGILISLIEGAPAFGWVILLIFVVFSGVWGYYWWKLYTIRG